MYYSRYNTRVKCYPDGGRKAVIASRAVFKHPDDISLEPIYDDENEIKSKPKDMTNESRYDSVNRAKSRIHDIVRMNTDFKWFVTLTFDPKKNDSRDVKTVSKIIGQYLSNAVQRNELKYLLVAEYHKSGAIHLHGFINDSLKMIRSDTVKAPKHEKPIKIDTARKYGLSIEECKPVYNIPSWADRYGYTTAVELDGDFEAVAKYVTKYITKDSSKIFGHYYLAGGHGLIREVPYYVLKTDNPMSVHAEHSSYCEPIDTWFKYLDSSREEDEKEMDLLGI